MNNVDLLLSSEFDRLVDMAEAHIREKIEAYGKKVKGSFTIGTSLTGDTEYAEIPFPLEKTESIRSLIAEIGNANATLWALKRKAKQYNVFLLEHNNRSYLAFQFYDTWIGCFKLKTAKLFVKKLEERLSDTTIKFNIRKVICCTQIRVKYHST